MKHSTKRPTVEDTERFKALREIGCLACYIDWITARYNNPKAERLACGTVEIHHQNEGGHAGQRRRGHDYTVPLGRWHHVGRVLEGVTVHKMEGLYGPSLARSSKKFRERYGDDDQLLDLANALLTARGALKPKK